MFMFLVIKITLMVKEGSLSQRIKSFGKGCPYFYSFHNILKHLKFVPSYSVCTAVLLNFRYKNMDSKYRHHYEVIQEVASSSYLFLN
jgi:hypothetical protein